MKTLPASPLLLAALAVLTGCGALSNHQSPKLMRGGEKAWAAGIGAGPMTSCESDTAKAAFGNDCVLTLDPYVGWRWGFQGDGYNPRDLAGDKNGEWGIKVSGVPVLGGTVLADLRLQRMTEPAYLTYDFGFSIFPCLSEGFFDEEEEDAPDLVDQEKKSDCKDYPFGVGSYAGFTFGAEWLHAGLRYGIGGNSWDGLQLLPGINIGSAFGPRWLKIIPSVDVYFYQWPLRLTPDLRVLVGVGLQGVY